MSPVKAFNEKKNLNYSREIFVSNSRQHQKKEAHMQEGVMAYIGEIFLEIFFNGFLTNTLYLCIVCINSQGKQVSKNFFKIFFKKDLTNANEYVLIHSTVKESKSAKTFLKYFSKKT